MVSFSYSSNTCLLHRFRHTHWPKRGCGRWTGRFSSKRKTITTQNEQLYNVLVNVQFVTFFTRPSQSFFHVNSVYLATLLLYLYFYFFNLLSCRLFSEPWRVPNGTDLRIEFHCLIYEFLERVKASNEGLCLVIERFRSLTQSYIPCQCLHKASERSACRQVNIDSAVHSWKFILSKLLIWGFHNRVLFASLVTLAEILPERKWVWKLYEWTRSKIVQHHRRVLLFVDHSLCCVTQYPTDVCELWPFPS